MSCKKQQANRRLLPSVAIAIDGVLAKRSQYALDILTKNRLGYPGSCDQLTESLDSTQCAGCSGCKTPVDVDATFVNNVMTRGAGCWSDMEPYEDVDFDEINRAMIEGEFIGHFLACRFPLDTTILASDHRFATKVWLDSQCRAPFQSYSLNVDICRNKVVDWLSLLQVDHLLSASEDIVLAAHAAGINAVLITRSWNAKAEVPVRVKTVAEFLENSLN